MPLLQKASCLPGTQPTAPTGLSLEKPDATPPKCWTKRGSGANCQFMGHFWAFFWVKIGVFSGHGFTSHALAPQNSPLKTTKWGVGVRTCSCDRHVSPPLLNGLSGLPDKECMNLWNRHPTRSQSLVCFPVLCLAPLHFPAQEKFTVNFVQGIWYQSLTA